MRENKIETYLKMRVKEEGGICIKLKFIARAGAPDRLVLLKKRHFLAELKRTGQTAEDHQSRLHTLLRWAGFEVYVLDSFELIDEVLCRR